MRARSLNWHVQQWAKMVANGQRVVKLSSGKLVILDPVIALGSLKNLDLYVDESAFFRTSNFAPLSLSVRRRLSREMLKALQGDVTNIGRTISSEWGAKGRIQTQGWGVKLIRSHYREVFNATGNIQIDQHIDRFIRLRTIRRDIRGQLGELPSFFRFRDRAELGRAIRESIRSHALDFVQIVKLADSRLEDHELGELYLRLIQSVVAFAGIALEMAVVNGLRIPSGLPTNPDSFILETLRMYPTSWRMVRVVKVPHKIDGIQLVEGDEVVIATSAIHRNADVYSNPNVFDAERFTTPHCRRSPYDLAFGRGRGMCPARSVALNLTSEALGYIFDNYAMTAGSMLYHQPYVRAILSPPRVLIRYIRKSR